MEAKNDPKEKPGIPLPSDDDFLEPYYRKQKYSSAYWKRVFMVVTTIAAILYFKFLVIDETIKPDELIKAVRISGLTSQWAVKEDATTAEDKQVVLVPEITFRLQNESKKKLKYIYFLSVFRYVDTGKAFGEGTQMTMKSGLKSGQESPPINIRCGGGYRASSVDAFLLNRNEWKNLFVDLYVSSKNSGLVQIKQHHISQKIAGREIDISLK